MEFGILGPLEVRQQHRRIEMSSAKERLLLAVLVVRVGEVVSKDRLIEVLWAGDPPASAVNTVHTYISHLRQVLNPERAPRAKGGLIETRGDGYVLAVPPDAVDAVRFERLVREGRDALGGDPAHAAGVLRTALALWRGEPLGEFAFELFAQAEIVQLTELRAAAVEDRVEADLALGRHAVLCAELSRAVLEQPLRERLWSQLIRALYGCGRQAEALAAYARLREQLGEQLGIDPSPELVRLHEAMLAQRAELDWQPSQPPATRRSLGPAELPAAAELLSAAHKALAAHDWQRAFELLSAADQLRRLGAEDLDGLAEATCWLGRYRKSVSAGQRAYHAFLRAGDHRRAALAATRLARQYGGLRRPTPATRWFQRAQWLLADEPDCAEQGYLSWVSTRAAMDRGDHETALAAARSTYEVGVRHGVTELCAIGLIFQGSVLIYQGQVTPELALLDEGMVMAVSGALSPGATVTIFCRTIATCYELSDYRRAAEWTEAIEDCFARTGLTSFPGDSETHRIAMMISRGAWALAEQLARRACARTQCLDRVHTGVAFARIGDIRLGMGDLASAEAAFAKAEELGTSPLPGRARLMLLRDRPADAAALINAAVVGASGDRLHRSRLLPDQVTIALAVGDLDTAREATAELAELAQIYGSKAMLAAAECARGALCLATGEDDPLPPLRRGVNLWQEAGAPYENARARMLLTTALHRSGQPEAAQLELTAARASFDRLGAQLDAEAAAKVAAELAALGSVM